MSLLLLLFDRQETWVYYWSCNERYYSSSFCWLANALLCSLYLEQTYRKVVSNVTAAAKATLERDERWLLSPCFSFFVLYQKHNKEQAFSFLLMRNDNSPSGKQNKPPPPPPSAAAAAVCVCTRHKSNAPSDIFYLYETTINLGVPLTIGRM